MNDFALKAAQSCNLPQTSSEWSPVPASILRSVHDRCTAFTEERENGAPAQVRTRKKRKHVGRLRSLNPIDRALADETEGDRYDDLEGFIVC